MKRLLLSLIAVSVLSAATTTFAESAATQPSVLSASTQPIALVNGEPIDRQKFDQGLMLMSGPRLFDLWMSTLIAVQECGHQGLQITPKQVQAEKDLLLKNLADQGVPSDQREAALEQALKSRGVTAFEFGLTMQRNAALRALSKGRGDPTDDQVRQAFDLNYGDRVVVLDVVAPDRATVAALKIDADTKHLTIPEVAELRGIQRQQVQISKSAPTGPGLPEVIKTIAFQLKDGETSAIIPLAGANGSSVYHILYCVKTIPADTTVKFEDVKTKVHDALQQQLETAWGEAYLRDRIANSKIDVKDPILSAYLAEQMAKIKAQRDAAASATQPATAPAK